MTEFALVALDLRGHHLWVPTGCLAGIVPVPTPPEHVFPHAMPLAGRAREAVTVELPPYDDELSTVAASNLAHPNRDGVVKVLSIARLEHDMSAPWGHVVVHD